MAHIGHELGLREYRFFSLISRILHDLGQKGGIGNVHIGAEYVFHPSVRVHAGAS